MLDVVQGRRFEDFQLQHAGAHAGKFAEDGFQARDEIGLLEVARRDVHADHPVLAGVAPALHLPQGLAQHPFADVDDQIRLLHQGQELRRRQHAAARMLPAQQRFHAHHRAGAHVHLRLVVQPQFAVDQGLAHFRALVVVGAHFLVEIRVEEVVLVAPRQFGLVDGVVGVAQQAFRIQVLACIHGDAGAGRHVQRLLVALVGTGQLGHQLRDVLFDAGDAGLAAQQQDEFIAAQARRIVNLSRKAVQPAGHLLEDFIACLGAVAVVDGLEVVEVEQAHGQQALAFAREEHFLLEAGGQRGPVGQARQHVIVVLP